MQESTSTNEQAPAAFRPDTTAKTNSDANLEDTTISQFLHEIALSCKQYYGDANEAWEMDWPYFEKKWANSHLDKYLKIREFCNKKQIMNRSSIILSSREEKKRFVNEYLDVTLHISVSLYPGTEAASREVDFARVLWGMITWGEERRDSDDEDDGDDGDEA